MSDSLFSIAPTSNGAGIGVVAKSLIKPGTLIVSNSPLVQIHRTSDTAHEDLTALVNALDNPAVYRDLCRSFPEQEGDELGDWDVLCTNGFGLSGKSGEDERTTGVYEQLSRFNHTCSSYFPTLSLLPSYEAHPFLSDRYSKRSPSVSCLSTPTFPLSRRV
jgi:hypothetical protein